jgi:hypothetical protein
MRLPRWSRTSVGIKIFTGEYKEPMLVRIDIPAQKVEEGVEIESDCSITTSIISSYKSETLVITTLEPRVTNPTNAGDRFKVLDLERSIEDHTYLLYGECSAEDGGDTFELKVSKVTVIEDFPDP